MVQEVQTGKIWTVVFLSCLCWAIPAFADDSFAGSPFLLSDLASGSSDFAESQAYLLAQASTQEMPYSDSPPVE